MKKIKTICLVIIALVLFGFYAQPVQAGFFGWLKLLFTNKQPQKILSVSVSEPLKEIPQEGMAEEVPKQECPICKPEIVIKEVIKEIPTETIVYRDNVEQTEIIENLKGQISLLKANILELQQKLEEEQARIKIKEVPMEKIVYQDKIIYQEVPQECPQCPVCSVSKELSSTSSESFSTYKDLHCPVINKVNVKYSKGGKEINISGKEFQKESIDMMTFTVTATDPQGLPLHYSFRASELVGNIWIKDFEWSENNVITVNLKNALVGPNTYVQIRVKNQDDYSCLGSNQGADVLQYFYYDVIP